MSNRQDAEISWLKQVIENNDTVQGRAFDLVIQALIIVSLVTFSVETLPDLSPRTRSLLRTIEVATVAVFTVEYVLRIPTIPLYFYSLLFG
jgi:voltage-gated potassium channel